MQASKIEHDNERFNELRLRQITGTLSSSEQAELDAMMQERLDEADAFLAPHSENQRKELLQLDRQIEKKRIESVHLIRLFLRQEQEIRLLNPPCNQ